jgi:hypothetical protein
VGDRIKRVALPRWLRERSGWRSWVRTLATARALIYFATMLRRWEVRFWDPAVRSGRVAHVVEVQLSVRSWDPPVGHVVRVGSGTRLSANGTRLSGPLDPPVGPVFRSDRRVGPACQVRPMRGTRVSDGSV